MVLVEEKRSLAKNTFGSEFGLEHDFDESAVNVLLEKRQLLMRAVRAYATQVEDEADLAEVNSTHDCFESMNCSGSIAELEQERSGLESRLRASNKEFEDVSLILAESLEDAIGDLGRSIDANDVKAACQVSRRIRCDVIGLEIVDHLGDQMPLFERGIAMLGKARMLDGNCDYKENISKRFDYLKQIQDQLSVREKHLDGIESCFASSVQHARNIKDSIAKISETISRISSHE
jgi:hypothetical protein